MRARVGANLLTVAVPPEESLGETLERDSECDAVETLSVSDELPVE